MTEISTAQVAYAREESQMDNTTTSPNAETSADLRSPAEWCHIERVEILDADGWRGRDGRDFSDPISLAEFRERLVVCTQRSIPLQESPITGRQYPRPQQPGGVTIGGTSGPWLAGAPIDASLAAGEHHAGALNLTGEGNEAEDRLPNNIDPAAVEAAARAHIENAGWDWTNLDQGDLDHDATKAVLIADMRIALRAAYPAIRQQAAEEIAVAIEAQVGDGEWAGDYYRKAAQTAREIGAKA